MTPTNMCSNFGGLWYSPPPLNFNSYLCQDEKCQNFCIRWSENTSHLSLECALLYSNFTFFAFVTHLMDRS